MKTTYLKDSIGPIAFFFKITEKSDGEAIAVCVTAGTISVIEGSKKEVFESYVLLDQEQYKEVTKEEFDGQYIRTATRFNKLINVELYKNGNNAKETTGK